MELSGRSPWAGERAREEGDDQELGSPAEGSTLVDSAYSL